MWSNPVIDTQSGRVFGSDFAELLTGVSYQVVTCFLGGFKSYRQRGYVYCGLTMS